MIDDELIAAVRDCVTDVRTTTPVEQIVRRGRAVRTRRRIPGLAGAVALMAGAALVVSALAPASHQASHRRSIQLTAWTVVQSAHGNIVVHISELRDPAGLQRKLRADGIPASVTFSGHQNRSCRPYPASMALINRVFPSSQPPPVKPRVVIHPAALPDGAGVKLTAGFSKHPAAGGAEIAIGVGLVHVSRRCTGS